MPKLTDAAKRKAEPAWGLEYCQDREFYRVWRTDWFGDQFEVVKDEEFLALKVWCKRLAIPLIEVK